MDSHDELVLTKIVTGFESHQVYAMSFKSADQILEEFFVKESDELYSADTRKRRSVLLELTLDLKYSLGFPGRFRGLQLTSKQQAKLGTEVSPISMPALVYCSAVDVIARAYHKRKAPQGKNAEWFKESAVKFFGYDEALAEVLWRLRNSLAHQYTINGFIFTRSLAANDLPISKISQSNNYLVATRKCLSNLEYATSKIYQHLLTEEPNKKNKTAEYLEEHFVYYQV